MKEIIKKNRNVLLILIDILIIISCYIASILFLNVPIDNIKVLVVQIAVVVIVYQIFLNIFRMYQNMMRYEVGKDYIKYIISAFLSMIISSIRCSPRLSRPCRISKICCSAESKRFFASFCGSLASSMIPWAVPIKLRR